MWQGRRGLIASAVCLVLGLISGVALLLLVERTTIAPPCRAHAAAHDMTYTDFTVVGVRTHTTIVCQLKSANGAAHDIHLSELVSTFTDLWAGILVTLEFTVPALAILFALARVALYRLGGLKGAEPAGAE
jgi:uncharacterized membrane protein